MIDQNDTPILTHKDYLSASVCNGPKDLGRFLVFVRG